MFSGRTNELELLRDLYHPAKKRQDDIDILLLDKGNESGIFCECKFSSALFDRAELEDLISASEVFPRVKRRWYFLFSKSGFTRRATDLAAEMGNVRLISADDLFFVRGQADGTESST